MIVPGLTPITCHILLELRRGCGEMYYGYQMLETPEFPRKELEKAIKVLKEIGIVDYRRGLMNDDGEVAGSGFGIRWGEPYTTAELAIYRYKFGDLDSIPHSFVLPNRIVIGGETYTKEDSHD